ncbi:MAG TPA: YegP family protein [Malonomonas sp.]
MAGKFEIKTAKDGQFYFNLKAGNGEVILTSQMYKAKSGALNGAESVRTNSGDDSLYERKVSSSDKPFFTIKAKNHQTIGKSGFYSSAAAMEKGIESVKKSAPEAKVVELLE